MISPRDRLKHGATIYQIDAAMHMRAPIPGAGELRDLVEIQSPTVVTQADGGTVTTWTTSTHVWAQIHALRGKEYIEADNVAAQVTHRIRIRAEPPYTMVEIMAREAVA